MSKKVKFRHELKYMISEVEKQVLWIQLKNYLSLDEHAKEGSYFIRSLYFDDIWESAYQDKLAGISGRKKFRIRNYNHSNTVIHLECKRKQGNYIFKESVRITQEEVNEILKGNLEFLRAKSESLFQEFYYECVVNRLRPKVIVDYAREPYVFSYGDVRITFDQHVRAGIFSVDMFDTKLPTFEVLEPQTLILEVKFTEYLPQLIEDILVSQNTQMLAASKYVLCLEKQKEFIC